MVVRVVNWPCSLIRPLNSSYFIQWAGREAGVNLFGVPQVISPNVGIRRVTFEIPIEFDETRLKNLEAKVAEMRGRYNIANICICDPLKYGSNVNPAQRPFDDGTWFDDGTGFNDLEENPDGEGIPSQPVIVTTAAAAGTNELWVDLEGPPAIPRPRPGDMFSHNFFLYTVVGVTNAGWIRFEPDARVNIPVGAELEFGEPHFYGRFVDEGQGQRMRQYLRYGQAITLSFVEAFDRP